MEVSLLEITKHCFTMNFANKIWLYYNFVCTTTPMINYRETRNIANNPYNCTP